MATNTKDEVNKCPNADAIVNSDVRPFAKSVRMSKSPVTTPVRFLPNSLVGKMHPSGGVELKSNKRSIDNWRTDCKYS